MTPTHQAALGYASRGIPVFICSPNSKQPATPNGFKDATTNPAIINAWFGAELGALGDWNIAAEPGAFGCAVVDLDDKDGKEGSKVWASLCADTAPTLTTSTPSGGRHLWFTGTLPSSVGTAKRGLGPGIDVRSIGGYVLLPPSSIDGKSYTWAVEGMPAPLPSLVEARLANRSGTYTPAAAPENVEVDPEGIEAWAIGVIQQELAENGPAVYGNSVNDRRMRMGMTFGDGPASGFYVSVDTAAPLVRAHWLDAPRTEETLINAYASRQNALGCGPIDDPTRKWGDAAANAEKWVPAPKVIRLKNGADIPPKAVEWIWPGWLARGKFHTLAGEAGSGKSTISFTLLAAITAGGTWPDGTKAPLGDVLIWSGEDDTNDTIMPRIIAAGGNPKRVWFPDREPGERAFDPATDFPGLLKACGEIPNLQVIMIDPIVAATTGDSHKNAETRKGLQPVVDFAEQTGAAVLGITHYTKGTQGKNPLERITGSLAFGALARVAWGTARGEDEGAPRRLVRVKNNLDVTGGGFEYTLERVMAPGLPQAAQRAAWGRILEGSALDLLDEIEGAGGPRMSATDFLATMLTDAGTAGVLVVELKAAAAAHSLSWRMVEKAKTKMPLVVARKNLGQGAPWRWELMPAPTPA